MADEDKALLGDWSPDELEQHGQEVLALLRDYFANIEQLKVMPQPDPTELLHLLDGPLPEQPEPFTRILQDTREKIIPNLTHWNHPSFFAYFDTSGSGPGILGDLATAAFNVNAMVWKSSPAASTLATVVLRWLAEMAGYPGDADGVLINGASLASFYALAAARESLGLNIREQGMSGRDLPALRLYISDQTHSSLPKAAIALGIGLENVVAIPSGPTYRMDPQALDAAITRDIVAGYKPLAVCATVGTTSTAAVDPIGAIAGVCRKHDVWLHIDAAYGGFWGIVPGIGKRIGDLTVGDSLVVNPHKVLFTPLEVTAFYCKRKDALRDTFSLVAEYLRTDPGDNITNYMDYSLQLGQQFRALKLWWVIRSFGLAGLRARLAESVRQARWLEDQVDNYRDYQRLGGSPFPLVCLRAFPHDLQVAYANTDAAGRKKVEDYLAMLNQAVMNEVNASGEAYLSHTVLREGYTLRVAIGNIRTEQRHVEKVWRLLQRAGLLWDARLRLGTDLPVYDPGE